MHLRSYAAMNGLTRKNIYDETELRAAMENPFISGLNSKPLTLKPKPLTLNPKPLTLNP
jgi:hypothetical protein